MDEAKKRRIRNMAILGAISGGIVSLVLYFMVDTNPSYFIFAVFGGLIGAAQAYMS